MQSQGKKYFIFVIFINNFMIVIICFQQQKNGSLFILIVTNQCLLCTVESSWTRRKCQEVNAL